MRKKRKRKEIKIKKERGKIFPKRVLYFLYSAFISLFALVLIFSFLEEGGIAGKYLKKGTFFFFGSVSYFLPIVLFILAVIIGSWRIRKKAPFILSLFLFYLSLPALFKIYGKNGGLFGLLGSIFLKFFGNILAVLIFSLLSLLGIFLFILSLGREGILKKKKRSLPLLSPKEIKEIKKPFLPLKAKPLKIFTISQFLKKEKISKRLFKEKLFPPIDLLKQEEEKPIAGNIEKNREIIKRTLLNFGIPVQMGEVNVGSTVTQYTLKPAEGIKLSKIVSLSRNLALALAAHPIRIEAPIPGKSLVGIEIPNRTRAMVRLKNLISDPFFIKAPPLTFSLGRDVVGKPVFEDLSEMPHLLVAGATGTGKTIFLNNLIINLIYKNPPSNLRLILIDPKRVEFSFYSRLPHLLLPVVYEPPEAINVLVWLVKEMEDRFKTIAQAKARDIWSYNKKKGKAPLPILVLIIDELADLMTSRGREVEAGIVRLAQLARAVGIHLIVATQRPSVEVITGLIKANITSRVTFQVASQVDSRTVIDQAGAEKLLGRGDMLFISAKNPKPKRIQAPYVSEKEIKRVVDYLASHFPLKKDPYAEIIETLKEQLSLPSLTEGVFLKEDPLYPEAKRLVVTYQKASASFLQRRLGIGYARAARLIDLLEEKGIVGPSKGAKPREVYLKPEDLQNENKV